MQRKKPPDIDDITNASNIRNRRYQSAFRNSLRSRTHTEIIRQATKILRDGGVDALTFEQLATNCGVGLRTVFRHFKTRQVLLDEVIASLSESKSHSNSPDLASIVLDCCQENEALGMLAPSAPLSDDLTSRIAMNLGDTPHGHRAMICTTLLSAGVWHHLRRKHALTIKEATDCLTWAISELAHRPLARAPVPAAEVQEEEFID